MRLRQDFQYGIRMLLKNPGSALIAALTLALGIGANTAIFSVLGAVLLRPFPYQDVNKLMMFYFTNPKGEETQYSTAAGYHNLKAQNTVFTDVAAWGNGTWPANLTGNRGPQRLLGLQVSANFFRVLGVGPMQGRTFVDEEDGPNGSPVVVLSYAFWQSEFGRDPDIVGRSITLNGAPYQVIGVMPASFRFLLKTDLWTPLVYSAGDALHLTGRLSPGVQHESARAEVESLLLPYAYNPTSDLHAHVKPLQTVMTPQVREPLLILYAAVSFVLLIACVNVATRVSRTPSQITWTESAGPSTSS